MQFGEGGKIQTHTETSTRGMQAAWGRQNPALAPAWVPQADFLSVLLGAVSSAFLVGRLAAQ